MIFQSILGLVVLTVIAWALSENRRRVSWRIVVMGFVLQFALALLLLKLSPAQEFFLLLNHAMLALERATQAGTSFVFGYLGGGDTPFEQTAHGSSFILAFRALPIILVMSALSALLFHWRILPWVVRGCAWTLQRSLGIGGAVGVAAAANIFVGMVESPLLIRPYLSRMTRSELFVVMTCGMATIAGTVMVLNATLLTGVIPNAMGNILTASLISAPAAIMIARLMVPEDAMATEAPSLVESEVSTGMEAITKGTADGVVLLINVVAMLIVLVALVAIVNEILGLLPNLDGTPITLQRILGYAMSPVAWLMGIPWSEAVTAGSLLGTKTVLNELVAYLHLSQLPADALSDHSRLIMTYALCGFANFGSLGIMLGGLATLVPEHRREVVGLGLKSIVAGTLATCLTGTVVGVL